MSKPSVLLREARLRAGSSQRALARRAGTAQSVVARIEAGLTCPSWSTLERLLAALDAEIRATIVTPSDSKSHVLDDVARILELSPEARLLELRNFSRFVDAARRVP